ncbi:MAG: hypothetical protein Tsb0026_08710 [Sulfuricaulis sp.]
MGEGDFTETTLRVLIEYTRLDPGMRQLMQKQMGLRQVGRRTETPHLAPPNPPCGNRL